MPERPPANVVTIAAGICFIALGGLLWMHRAGIIELREIIDLWPVALILLGGALVWQATRGGERGTHSGGAIAALVWLGIIGLIFSYVSDRKERIESLRGNGRVDVFALMAGQRQLDRTGPFRGGYITTVMGGALLDLREMTIAPGEEAVLDVFTVFGGSDIRVPPEWIVEINATTIAAGIDDSRSGIVDDDDGEEEEESRAAEPAGATVPPGDEATVAIEMPDEPPTLVITGTILMGGVKIRN